MQGGHVQRLGDHGNASAKIISDSLPTEPAIELEVPPELDSTKINHLMTSAMTVLFTYTNIFSYIFHRCASFLVVVHS